MSVHDRNCPKGYSRELLNVHFVAAASGWPGQESPSSLMIKMEQKKLSFSGKPEMPLDRVAEIKARIQNGTYEVDTRKIASRMLLESLDMIPRKSTRR